MISIIYSTSGNIEEARKIGRLLVEEKFVACVNIIPKVESIYRWQGKIEEDNECILLAKTINNNIEKTIKKIKELHSYDVPDIVVIPITHGLKDYLDWVKVETL
jgi:periplasmic divalent cation tolerance protein